MVHVPITDLLPDFLGETIDGGRLKLVQRLGSGAYGIVYKALDTTSPSYSPVFYAVKCLKKYPVGEKEAVFQVGCFVSLFKLHKMVSGHANILTMHRHFSDGKHIFVVLDYCAGGDLFLAITDKRLFYRNDALVKQAFVQILDAVQYCHDRHVFHRDLKPENILYDAEGNNIWLADFGLSTQAGSCGDYGLGSPFYMSPESIEAEQHGSYSCRHSDIWALGVVLTNMISGRNPWKVAKLDDDCYLSYLSNNDFLLNSLPISRGANTILKWCFQLHPVARPSIAQIREAVLKLDTFFLNDEELAHASSAQRAIAQYYATPTPEDEVYSPDSDQEGTLCDPEINCSTISSLDPEEVYLYKSPPFSSPWSLAPPAKIQSPANSSSLSTSEASSGDSSSLGASDISSGVDSNNEPTVFHRFPAPTTQIAEKPTSRPGSLWKRTMRRLKAIGI
ncbi:Serine/threonine protein kinase [Mycena sanguinolenta]|uniref:non-specific serine/threonine protein kinase n=1 Tax=Mycena sanguinolenta TaxID=230812 RepID=A0A8H6YBH9_9AGAR|nr:Serine/threonine protein kinase [Mycena sanguinolenta]